MKYVVLPRSIMFSPLESPESYHLSVFARLSYAIGCVISHLFMRMRMLLPLHCLLSPISLHTCEVTRERIEVRRLRGSLVVSKWRLCAILGFPDVLCKDLTATAAQVAHRSLDPRRITPSSMEQVKYG